MKRTALVTGAGSGIGAATARTVAGRGIQTLLVDIRGDAAASVAEACRAAGGTALAMQADASQPDDCRRAVERAVREFGRLDLAVNNIGAGSNGGLVAQTDPAEWDRVVRINLGSVFYGMRYQIPAMLQSGGGAIVNISSVMGVQGVVGNAPYVASKHGIVGLTKSAALEYGGQGIRVNAVGPGYIDTPMLLGAAPPARLEEIARRHALGRLGHAQEVANLVVFLLSEEASFISGSYHLVDGGFTAGHTGAGANVRQPGEA